MTVTKARWICVLGGAAIAACARTAPRPVVPPARPPAPSAPSVAIAHRVYPISNGGADGAMHVTTLSIDVPASWRARFETANRSPAFETAPNETIMIVDAIEAPKDDPVGFVRKTLFDDADPAKLERTDQGAAGTWVVDRRPDGRIHAARLVAEMQGGQPTGFVVLCETRLGANQASRLGEMARICGTLRIESIVDHPVHDPLDDAPPPPRHVRVKDIVQPSGGKNQP